MNIWYHMTHSFRDFRWRLWRVCYFAVLPCYHHHHLTKLSGHRTSHEHFQVSISVFLSEKFPFRDNVTCCNSNHIKKIFVLFWRESVDLTTEACKEIAWEKHFSEFGSGECLFFNAVQGHEIHKINLLWVCDPRQKRSVKWNKARTGYDVTFGTSQRQTPRSFNWLINLGSIDIYLYICAGISMYRTEETTQLVTKGIPNRFRRQIWMTFSGAIFDMQSNPGIKLLGLANQDPLDPYHFLRSRSE